MIKPGIPAAEYLGICLIMADLDLDMNMLEIIDRVETYEEAYGLMYGTWEYDIRSACIHIIGSDFYEEYRSYKESMGRTAEYEDFLRLKTLRDFVKPILRREYLWCNDEGCSWDRYPEDEGWPEEKKRLVEWRDADGEIHDRFVRGNLNDRFLIKASLRFDRRMRELFKDGCPDRPELLRFFQRSHYARAVPYYWANRL